MIWTAIMSVQSQNDTDSAKQNLLAAAYKLMFISPCPSYIISPRHVIDNQKQDREFMIIDTDKSSTPTTGVSAEAGRQWHCTLPYATVQPAGVYHLTVWVACAGVDSVISIRVGSVRSARHTQVRLLKR